MTATLVPWAHADRLRKLVYALPPTMLATYRVAAIAEGLFVIGEQGIDGLPIGDMFQEAAPSIYVPLGMEFYPRVGAEVLTDHIGGVDGALRGVPARRARRWRSSTRRSSRSGGARWRGSRSTRARATRACRRRARPRRRRWSTRSCGRCRCGASRREHTKPD